MRLVWVPSAVADLEEIHDYLRDNYPRYLHRTMNEIYRAVQSLKQMPFRGRPGREPGIREYVMPKLPYIIFYRTNLAVEILYIRHGARASPDVT
jgi:toxin ParE1/3/4